MDVYTVTNNLGKTANVKGTIYLNGRPVESKSYDAILWLAPGEEPYPPNCLALLNLRVLVIYFRDFRRALLLKELGYS